MTENPHPADSPPEQVPLAVRRLRKLRARYPEATPADLVERLGGIFVRDFTLVGSAQAGVQELTPNLLGSVTRNRRVAGLTQAAAHLGALQQGMATYSQAANKGINTTAHVGSAQAVKTYLQGMALLYGLEFDSGDKAAAAILGQDVNDLLTQLENMPSSGLGQGQQMNILGAVAAIGLRNPQTLLLVKAGEQLVRAGGAVFASQKVRRDFAQQLIAQVEQNLGAAPAQLAASSLALLDSGQEASSPGPGAGQGRRESAPDPDDPDLLELSAEEVGALEEPAPPAGETRVRPSTEAELAAADGASARGARLAARAFVRARSRFKG
ncbi:MAG: hypothetical protein SOR40_05170 [Rothia sp. (in: high G+C Gram-positive bacteria)]|nr:hypothetical protein [Rothia sp. (in: high G+C Gram-positive bacteria)]